MHLPVRRILPFGLNDDIPYCLHNLTQGSVLHRRRIGAIRGGGGVDNSTTSLMSLMEVRIANSENFRCKCLLFLSLSSAPWYGCI